MNELEKRLKALPLAMPPEDLAETIFGSPAPDTDRWRLGIWLARPIRLGWSLGLAILMSGVGFLAARLGGLVAGREGQSAQNEVVVRIIENQTVRNNFDFSCGAADGAMGFLSGDVALNVQNEGALEP